ncbi:MAG TPA: porin family protein, partial [Flavisolibacter sp.]|nr:porin family protein [Flavisolibacter sp.]
NTEQSKDYTSRLGPFFGISFTKKLSSFINLQTEINYSPQGGKRNGMQPIDASSFGVPAGTALYADFKNETKLSYLEVPVLLQLYGESPKNYYRIFYFVSFGPYAAVRLKAQTVTSGTSSIYLDKEGTVVLTMPDGSPIPPQTFNSTTNIKDEIKRMSAGITGGISSGYNFDGNKFFIEARFTRGLINIQTSSAENGKNKTGSLIFAAGYMFSL